MPARHRGFVFRLVIAIYPLDGTRATTRLVLNAPTAAEWEHTSRWDGTNS